MTSMLLKRIHAATLPAEVAELERTCGKDALIVETKRTRRGYLLIAARTHAGGEPWKQRRSLLTTERAPRETDRPMRVDRSARSGRT